MFVHTVIMVIEPHMKQGRQHKLKITIFLATSVTKKLDHNILSKEPFPMDESGSYYPEDWGYLGEDMSLSEFQKETAEQLEARLEPQPSGGEMTMQP